MYTDEEYKIERFGKRKLKNVTGKIEFKNVEFSYPEYKEGWNVLAKTTGELTDLDTNRNLYALYYESESVYDFEIEEDGFTVRGEDVLKFLEEKLDHNGLWGIVSLF